MCLVFYKSAYSMHMGMHTESNRNSSMPYPYKKTHYFYRGNIVTKWNTLSGMSLGILIFTADDNNDDLIPYAGGTKQELIAYASRITVHEYGHTIQSMLLGLFMLIPGIISVAWGSMKRYERLRNELYILLGGELGKQAW